MGAEEPMEPYVWGCWTLLDSGGCAEEPGSPKISRRHPGDPENRASCNMGIAPLSGYRQM